MTGYLSAQDPTYGSAVGGSFRSCSPHRLRLSWVAYAGYAPASCDDPTRNRSPTPTPSAGTGTLEIFAPALEWFHLG